MNIRIPDLLSYISGIMTLEPGDLILTGSPHGMGSVDKGDTILAGINENFLKMQFRIV